MTQTQALATLEREDPVAAGDAKVALSWLAGDDGLGAISQLRLQEFLWHSLPMKWPLPPSGQVGNVRSVSGYYPPLGVLACPSPQRLSVRPGSSCQATSLAIPQR